jgi:hypothetical protein
MVEHSRSVCARLPPHNNDEGSAHAVVGLTSPDTVSKALLKMFSSQSKTRVVQLYTKQ